MITTLDPENSLLEVLNKIQEGLNLMALLT